ncbi:Protein WHAT'S THIS FACTOR 1-like protein [Bienertia sinuspersici]
MPLRELVSIGGYWVCKGKRFIALLKKFLLTPEAERLYFEELKIRNEMEALWLYPHTLRLSKRIESALELTHWTPSFVSAAEMAEEENRARDWSEELIIDRP